MSKNSLFFLLFLLIGLVSCAEQAPKGPPKAEKLPENPIVGGDSDEHGCKGSAGYSWSIVKNECIRLFESGIRLDPKAAALDKAQIGRAHV